jgi:PTH1 family peptidyl-tRNA hydrolase
VSLAPQGKFFGHVGRLGDLWLLQTDDLHESSGQAVVALARFYKIMPDEIAGGA